MRRLALILCLVLPVTGCAAAQQNTCPPPIVDYDAEGPQRSEPALGYVTQAAQVAGTVVAGAGVVALYILYEIGRSGGAFPR